MAGKIEKTCDDGVKHLGDVVCIAYQNGSVFTGGADGKIKVWDDNLKLKKEINAHEAYIYALTIDSKGCLYSTSCDGTLKLFEKPLESDDAKTLLKCSDELESLYVSPLEGESDNVVYSGDDKGIVTKWIDGKLICKFNMVEEVRGLAAENKNLYTIRDRDLTITEVMGGKSDKYTNVNSTQGMAPVCLFGPVQANSKKSFVAIVSRAGKGVVVIKNDPNALFATLWTKEDMHDMMVNALCGTDNCLYTGGWEGKIKRWVDIEQGGKMSGEAQVEGQCINCMRAGANNTTVFFGTPDGAVRKATF